MVAVPQSGVNLCFENGLQQNELVVFVAAGDVEGGGCVPKGLSSALMRPGRGRPDSSSAPGDEEDPASGECVEGDMVPMETSTRKVKNAERKVASSTTTRCHEAKRKISNCIYP